jgi:hypothetical protein
VGLALGKELATLGGYTAGGVESEIRSRIRTLEWFEEQANFDI